MPCNSGSSMDADACPFSRLPEDVRDAILIQAFKQLSQRQCRGTVPLVCSPWQKLSLSSCSSIKARIRRAASAQQLAAWLRKDSSNLHSISIHILENVSAAIAGDICDAISKIMPLRSLSLTSHDSDRRSLSPVLSSLTNLTSLSLCKWDVSQADTVAVAALTKLRSLKLADISGSHAQGIQFLTDIASSLKQLTSLEMSSWTCSTDLRPLTALSQLQELHLKHMNMHCSSLRQLQPLPLRSVCIDVNASSMSEFACWIQRCASRIMNLSIRGTLGSPPAPAQLIQLLNSLSRSASPQLQRLALWSCRMDHEAVAHLKPLTQLTELVLGQCSLNDLAGCQLAPLSNLQDLQLWGVDAVTGVDACVSSLASLPHLHLLLVGENASAAVLEAFGGCIVKRTDRFGRSRFCITAPGGHSQACAR